MKKILYFMTLAFFFVSMQSAFAVFEGLKKRLSQAKENVQKKVTTVTGSNKKEQESIQLSKQEFTPSSVTNLPLEKLTAEDYNQLILKRTNAAHKYFSNLKKIYEIILTSIKSYKPQSNVSTEEKIVESLYLVGINLGVKFEKLQAAQSPQAERLLKEYVIQKMNIKLSPQDLIGFKEELQANNTLLRNILVRLRVGDADLIKINQALRKLIEPLMANARMLSTWVDQLLYQPLK